MRKLKLQMQMSIDGFVAGPEGQLDWMSFGMDAKLKEYVYELTDSSDTILLGRKMTPGFISYWENVVDNQPESAEFEFAQKMVNKQKIVYSRSVKSIEGKNITVENTDLVTSINNMKNSPGNDLLVYGGAGFVSALIKNDLIDELNLFINPTAIGEGLKIFDHRKTFRLIDSIPFSSGIAVNKFKPTIK